MTRDELIAFLKERDADDWRDGYTEAAAMLAADAKAIEFIESIIATEELYPALAAEARAALGAGEGG